MAKVNQIPNQMLHSMKLLLSNKERQLEKRKRELKAEDPFADPDRLNDNAAIDMEAAEQSGHERVTAINREVDKMLIRVRKALTSIRLGKFGICEDCGQMIDTNRLAIDPTVQYCVECAKKKIIKSA
jgi:DnaK suppressor protein